MSFSPDVLRAFRDGRLVGTFLRRGPQHRISFRYDGDDTSTAVSLSLPRAGQHAAHAAENYLDGLLPDNPRVREGWAARLGVPNTPFDLAGAMGQDVAGALVLLPDGQAPADAAPAVLTTADDIAARIAALSHNPASWLDPELIGRVRLSLAGAQGKFSLARAGDRWFFPTAGIPSTHILKPPTTRFPELPELEAGSLELARRIGLHAATARAVSVRGQRSLLVTRFDRRTLDTGQAVRLHAEDLVQALGRRPGDKYAISARDAVQLLHRHGTIEDTYEFVHQLGFNTTIGNADAHAKNHTLMLDGPVPRLAPLYDVVPTMLWPEFDGKLSMRIAGRERPQELTPAHWAKFATTLGLDTDRVVEIAADTARQVSAHVTDAYRTAGLDAKTTERMRLLVASNSRGMLPVHSRPHTRAYVIGEPSRPDMKTTADDGPDLGI